MKKTGFEAVTDGRKFFATYSARGLLLSLLATLLIVPAVRADVVDGNLPPLESPVDARASLEHFRVARGLRIELVAAEPEVVDPVAIAFDERMRLWVAEMGDYPNGPKPGEAPKSRIRLLEDKDGDGYYETSHVFADHLLFATGVQPWRGGVIATLSGRVAYFRDTDGDNRADVEETWFTGFAEQNPQLRANHPTFALDNHIYIANGLRGGDVIARKPDWSKDAKPVSISGMDFRFDPLSGKYEAVSGNGQFGLTFDDYGNRFVCSNRNPCMHVVIEDRYLKHNPFLAAEGVVEDASPPGEQSRVYPLTRSWTTSTLHAGQFTAACGVTIYRGDLLPAGYLGDSFVCEPTGNLVHRDSLRQYGPTFRAKKTASRNEHLATRDEWFRPVNLANGPDGALYVVDMYRAVIEHPEWVPDELKNRPDAESGNDRGRIYRLVPEEAPHRHADPKNATTAAEPNTAQLLEWLAQPNGWKRDTAARLIYERQDKSVKEALTKLATTAKSVAARIQALWALEGLGVLTDSEIEAALHSDERLVEVQAVRLAELHWKDRPSSPALPAGIFIGDPRVRIQLILSLPEMGATSYVDRMTELALAGANDRWTRLAIDCSLINAPAEIFEQIIGRLYSTSENPFEGTVDLVKVLAEIIGARQTPEEIERAVSAIVPASLPVDSSSTNLLLRMQLAGMGGLGDGIIRRGGKPAEFYKALPKPIAARLQALVVRANELAGRQEADIALRSASISFLRDDDEPASHETLLKLATRAPELAIRVQAISALANCSDAGVAPALLADYSGQTPALRSAILDLVLARAAATQKLLDEIEAGRIRAGEIDISHSTQLTKHPDKDVQARAQRLLSSAIPADRKEVIEKYGKALTLTADPRRGREVFAKNCATCHRIGDVGVNVAPDIADSRTRTPAALLTDILDPNRAIDNNYFSYSLVMRDGRTVTGIVAAETTSSITLRQPENKTISVLRQDIEEMRSNGVSLMPIGLEKNVTVEEMANLISYIKNWRYLDERVPATSVR